MSINDLSGWAIRRNGSCHEKDCGPTEAPYHACCPFGTECSNPYNQNCCPAGTNCTVALVESPRCANESWSMYDNYGFFCCEEGQVGYGRGNTDGCSKSGASLPEDASPISLVNQVPQSSSTPSTSALTSNEPTSPPSTSGSDSTSSVPEATVSIVQGVIIGITFFILIVILALFLSKGKRSRRKDANIYRGPPYEKDATSTAPDREELDGIPLAELSNEAPVRLHELP